MSTEQLGILFLQIAVMLAAAWVCARAAQLLRYPPILGELAAGILLGPTVFGLLAPDVFHLIFLEREDVARVRDSIILVGVLYFLFSMGMEVDLRLVRGRAMSIAHVSGLGMLLPFALGIAMVAGFPALWGYDAARDGWILPIFIGTALSISALPVIARILLDLNLLRAEIGIVILTSAVITDLLGWGIFAVCLNLIRTNGMDADIFQVAGSIFLVLAILWLVTSWLVRPFLAWVRRHDIPGSFLGIASVCIFAAAALAERFGMHPALGAFLVGVVFVQFNRGTHESQMQEVLSRLSLRVFAPLYFVSAGLKVNFIEHFDLRLVLLVTVVAVITKVLGAGLGARLGGFDARTALAIGVRLNARGAIGIILATVALEHGLIDSRVFVALVLMALVTSMISGAVLKMLMPGIQGNSGASPRM